MGHLINVTLMLKEEINTPMNLRLIIWGTEDAVRKDLLSCYYAHSLALPRSHVLGLVFFLVVLSPYFEGFIHILFLPL